MINPRSSIIILHVAVMHKHLPYHAVAHIEALAFEQSVYRDAAATPRQRHVTLLQMLGVNLGGWVVLEQWMSPKLWAGIRGPHWLPFGEYQLMMGARCCIKSVPPS